MSATRPSSTWISKPHMASQSVQVCKCVCRPAMWPPCSGGPMVPSEPLLVGKLLRVVEVGADLASLHGVEGQLVVVGFVVEVDLAVERGIVGIVDIEWLV